MRIATTTPASRHAQAGITPRLRHSARLAGDIARSTLSTIALGFGAGLAISAVLTALVIGMAALAGKDTAVAAAPTTTVATPR